MGRISSRYIVVLIIGVLYCFSVTIPALGPDVLATTENDDCDNIPGLGCLIINKVVTDPNNLAGGLLDTLRFNILITQGGQTIRQIDLQNGDTEAVPLSPGTYTISEGNLIGGIGSDITEITGTGCESDGTVVITGTTSCVVTNEITGAAANEAIPPTSPANRAPVEITDVEGQAGTSTGSGQTLGTINPPFDTCFGNVEAGTGVSPTRTTEADDTNIVRAPNGATYTAGGTIPLEEVHEALREFGTRTVTIQIISDLQPNDQVALAVSAPQFKGAIVVEDSKGVKHEVVNFNLYTIRTECKFMTFAKAQGEAPNKNVYPLGVVGENKGLEPTEIDEILIQERASIVTATNLNFPSSLNPPFAVCQSPVVPRTATEVLAPGNFPDDDISIYNVRGEIDEIGKLNGNDLHMEINVDLNLKKTDQAKILDNNNPWVRVNLIADEDKDSAHQIPFTIHDLWTDCKDLALNNQPLFEPIQSEIPP